MARSERDSVAVLLDVLDRGVALVDRHGRIEHATPAFASALGVGHRSLVGRSVLDPPWRLSDDEGRPLAPESQPGALAVRSGDDVEATVQRDDDAGTPRILHLAARWVETDEGARGFVLEVSDRTELAELAAEVDRLRRTDPLTGLANRQHVVARLADELDAARRAPGARVGVLHVDLDGFRTINDTFGPDAGDAVLRTVCGRLADLADRHVTLGRVGVDEFLVVARGDEPAAAFDARLRRLGEEVRRRCEQPLELDGMELRVTASIGVARWPGDGDDAATLQRAADAALRAGRGEARQHLRFYDRSLHEDTRAGLSLDRDLRRAAAQRQLEVHYQPIIDLRSGRVAAAEALVRWHHPRHGPVAPGVFIPTAEATGTIAAVSDLVLRTVAEDVASWNASGRLPDGARVAINVSATEFCREGFVERLARTLGEASVSPHQIELEITETLLMTDLETTAERLRALDSLGFLVALDDFGTGYSSLSYLHTLPLHTLKVDRRFVGDLRDGRSETITRTILSLARGLGIVAVGEGVETEDQRRFLRDAGCDLVQGFLYAPPLPRPAFERFLSGAGSIGGSTSDGMDTGGR